MSSTPTEIDQLLHRLGFTTVTQPRSRDWEDTAESPEPTTIDGLSSSVGVLPLPPGNISDVPASPSRVKHPDASFQRMLLQSGKFFPIAPDTLADAGLHHTEVSDLILKCMALRRTESGFNIALCIGMKFPLVEGVLRQLKVDRLVSYKNSTTGGDYLYELTDGGRARAAMLLGQNSYLGTAPVPLDQYIAAVNAQSLEGKKPSLAAIRQAFEELEVGDQMISRIGQAIHSGRGMFLYGPAGNGKTSMAERITRSFGDYIWIPKVITASGEIIRLFDPNRHKPAPLHGCDPELLDGRWIQIERPTIVAGGELRMENLEITYIRTNGIGEAPLQMKANCGTLLIDDLGRQRMSIDELLNRWIVPLEHRYDYFHLESGRSIQVPFDQLIIFSSNLEPKDLVDEAFLRRIPYKIQVDNPSEEQFLHLFRSLAAKLKFQIADGSLEYLIETHYRQAGRSLRFCHPRDLLRQMENRCSLYESERIVNPEAIDNAITNYFSIM